MKDFKAAAEIVLWCLLAGFSLAAIITPPYVALNLAAKYIFGGL